MSTITMDDLSDLLDCVKRLRCARLAGDPDEIHLDEDALIRVIRRCLQSDVAIADDEVDRHLDAVLRASGSALRHYTMQKSLDDMRAAMRAAMLPVPLFDSQCRELCAALGWQGGTYHLVLAEVKRLKAAETSRDGAGPAPSLRPRRGEIDLLRWVADDISRQVGEGHGAWRSCSGCHELNEGHDTGPYSSTFRCALGRGCSECGGIGAVWDTTDYQALADAQKGGV
jgi:hypothetical protein